MVSALVWHAVHVRPGAFHSSALLRACPAASRDSLPHGRVCRADPGAGDARVQNTLEDMLRLQIDKEELKQMVAEEGAKLRLTAEEAREELEQLEQLSRARSDLAFGSAMADINREADEFEAQLRESRQRMEADRAAFAAWERETAAARSAGHFFKSLYQSESEAPASASLTSDDEVAARRAQQRRDAEAREAQRAPKRLYLYGFLATALLAASLADVLTSGTPALAQDALYAALALAFVARAWVERQPAP